MQEYEALKLDHQLCFPLYAASREIIRRYYPLLEALNLTYTQYLVMMVLWETPQCSAKQLGERLYLDSGTLTPVVKNLEAKGFVRRLRSKQDERMLQIEITPEGEALKQQASKVPPEIAKCVRLSPQEALQLHTLLYKILADAKA